MTNKELNNQEFSINNCSFLKLSELISSSVSEYILSIDNNVENIRNKKSTVSFPYISRIEKNKFQCLFKIDNHLHNIVIIFNNHSFKINFGYLKKDNLINILNILKSKIEYNLF